MRALRIACIGLALLPAAALPLPPCAAPLAPPGERIVRFGFGKMHQVTDNSLSAVRTIFSLVDPLDHEIRSVPRIGFFYGIFARPLQNYYRDFVAKFESDEAFREQYKAFVSQGTSLNYDFDSLYNQPGSPELYARFVSQVQQSLSAIFVSYLAARSALDLGAKLRIADFGSGIGDTIQALRAFFPAAAIAAFDKSPHLLRAVQRNHRIEAAIEGDFASRRIPFDDRALDLVTALFSANQYLPLDRFLRTLLEIRRILRPGGYVLFEYGPWNASVESTSTIGRFLELMEEQGFETEHPRIRIVAEDGRFLYPVLLRKPPEARCRKKS